MFKQKCKRCGYTWNSYLEKPKQCPKCKRMDWYEEKTKRRRRRINENE